MPDKKTISNPKNTVCPDCLFWKKFGKNCYVYWEKKKFCTMKVSDNNAFEETKNMFNINK